MLTDKSIYKLLPFQVPRFWDAIKYACIKADMLRPDEYGNYFNELLQELLSDKAQCFIILDKNKVLRTIAITKIIVNKISATKELYIQATYSMAMLRDDEAKEYINILLRFAHQEGCKRITFTGTNWRAQQVAEMLGFTERYRSYVYELGGE